MVLDASDGPVVLIIPQSQCSARHSLGQCGMLVDYDRPQQQANCWQMDWFMAHVLRLSLLKDVITGGIKPPSSCIHQTMSVVLSFIGLGDILKHSDVTVLVIELSLRQHTTGICLSWPDHNTCCFGLGDTSQGIRCV